MSETNRYEVTITIKPIPRRDAGVLGYSAPVMKESYRDVLDYGRVLTEFIAGLEEYATDAK